MTETEKRTTIEWLCALMTDREKIEFIDLLDSKKRPEVGTYNIFANQEIQAVIDLIRGTLPEGCNERANL